MYMIFYIVPLAFSIGITGYTNWIHGFFSTGFSPTLCSGVVERGFWVQCGVWAERRGLVSSGGQIRFWSGFIIGGVFVWG